LSYYTKDRIDNNVAIFLKSNIEARGIGVWYSEEILPHPDPAASEIAFNAIDEAHLFLPVITDNYARSVPCIAELACFFRHQAINPSRILLPVVHGSPNTATNFNWIGPIIDEPTRAELTEESFLDDLIALLGWIQKAVRATPYA
jgi:hypothetical protein